jgi:choline dehydrogenase-like flavoprotein
VPGVLIDARRVSAGTELSRDVCIVGAGPAGIAIALRLAGAGLTVGLVESGGFDLSLRNQRLYSGHNIGHDYFRLDGCRFRMFGGSTNRWGGWCRPLDPADYDVRPWVPHSGWPISEDEAAPHYARTAEMLDISSPEFSSAAWHARMPAPVALAGAGDFDSQVFQYSPQTNFGEKYRSEVLGHSEITTLLHANVTGLRLAEGSARVGTAEIRSFGGPAFTVRARAFVLAAGGLENPRILLASKHDRPAGLGNEHDTVGRYFQEHLHVPAGHVVPTPALADAEFYRRAVRDGASTKGVLTPTVDAQRRYGLLTCSIAVEDDRFTFGTPYVGWRPQVVVPAVRTLETLKRQRIPAWFGARLRGASELAHDEYRRRVTGRGTDRALARTSAVRVAGRPVRSLYFRTEQAPNPDSRVLLSRSTDALGMPRIDLDWRVSDVDTEVVTSWLKHLDSSLTRAGLGSVILPEEGWRDRIIGGPHHIGTTRMSADPRHGVVDRNCKVHSTDNLFVAGSSVFATGGYTNPTFTLVALALRLADHLIATVR